MKRAHKLSEFLILLIQNADDIDVGQFLLNISADFVKRTSNNVSEHYQASNKELLTTILLYPKLTRDKWLVITHLTTLACNYYSYFFYSDFNEKRECQKLQITADNITINKSSNNLNAMINNNIISFEDLNNIGKLDKNTIAEILHTLIENYKNYQLYYEIYDNTINKIQIKNYKLIEKSYNLDTDKTTFIVDETRNLKTDLQLYLRKTGYEEQIYTANQNLKYFKSANSKIIRALKRIDVPCKICLPKENKPKMRALCWECDLLIKNLKQLKLLTDNNLYKSYNFEHEIASIKLNNNDFITLRRERKKLINKMLKSAKKDIIKNQEQEFNTLYKKIKEQINYIFQV